MHPMAVILLVWTCLFSSCLNYEDSASCEGITCSGSGVCEIQSDSPVCDCFEGYAGDDCADCDEGYHDEHGNCVADESCNEASCSGHGDCDDTTGVVTCICHEGHQGSRCDECANGYQDHDRDGACLPGCSIEDCNQHGSCDDESGLATCACEAGWDGSSCQVEIQWVEIPAGSFMMGSEIERRPEEMPVHLVNVPAFLMNRTEVTVRQYRACVEAGACTEPDKGWTFGNWGVPGRDEHPVNCVDWFQASAYCQWLGVRLPSEAEWEYAARSAGQDITYPWGDELATCDYAIMHDEEEGYGCGMLGTWEVCSKPAGNTSQGLCDMSGNIYEWVQDYYHDDYVNAPTDGSAWEIPSHEFRITRGGCFGYGYPLLRSASRRGFPYERIFDFNGFRCSKNQ
ncbi:MAG: SUMF1/EgtB/PvdO family nonheme iron enzyme [Deltaproteobacteria bacterium]|nr:SUMF1/EgtB/PvdO family nonheme iron enzyme [Deltaproteobacteria bacterium]